MKESEAMNSRLYTSYLNVPATDFFMPVTQEHKLYLEGIDDDHYLLHDDKLKSFDSHLTSNKN
jgi:hypothetical protein